MSFSDVGPTFPAPVVFGTAPGFPPAQKLATARLLIRATYSVRYTVGESKYLAAHVIRDAEIRLRGVSALE